MSVIWCMGLGEQNLKRYQLRYNKDLTTQIWE